MVAEAKGKFILLLNNDAELHEDAISTLFNYSIEKGVYGIIGLAQYNIETDELLDIGSLFDPFLNPIPNRDRSRRNVGMVSGACMWLPRVLWDELGGFPEWFESIAEDMYLCCLARFKGDPVIALAESGFKHWVGRSFGGGKIIHNALQTTFRRRSLSERNKCYVMLVIYPAPLAYVLIPTHLLILAIEGLILTLLKGDPHIWTDIYKFCFKELWSNRSRVIRKRREIQVMRGISSWTYYSVHEVIPYKLKMLLKYGLPKVKIRND
jgi:GT2 family glycosyltransferase